MILAAIDADQTLTQWVVIAVAGAILTGLGFLVRNAFEGTTSAVKELGSKLDVITAAQASAAGDHRELKARHEERFESLISRIDKVEREVREISEGIAR